MKTFIVLIALGSLNAFACDYSDLAKEEKVLKVAEERYAANTINRIEHAAARSKYFDVAACARAYSWRMSCEGLIEIHDKDLAQARKGSEKELADAMSMAAAIRNYCL